MEERGGDETRMRTGMRMRVRVRREEMFATAIITGIAILLLLLAPFAHTASVCVSVSGGVSGGSNATLRIEPSSVVCSDVTGYGELVRVEGAGFEANSTVVLECAVTNFSIPVTECGAGAGAGAGYKYKYGLYGLNISDTANTSFTLSLHGVRDDTTVIVNSSLLPRPLELNKSSCSSSKLVHFHYNATTNTTEIVVKTTKEVQIPPEILRDIDIEVCGNATSGAVGVYADMVITHNVTTSASGGFIRVIDTHGIPPSHYNITATVGGAVLADAMLCITIPELSIVPSTVVEGERARVEGRGFAPNKLLTLRCVVSNYTIPVSAGEYRYELKDFNVTDSNTSFLLRVHNVKDDLGIRVPIWINERITNCSIEKLGFVFQYYRNNTTATVYHGPVSRGIYDIELRGTPIDENATNVTLDVVICTDITTNASGGFIRVIDTHGIPPWHYNITATLGGTVLANATLTIAEKAPAPTPTPTPSPSPSPSPTSSPTSTVPGAGGGGGGGGGAGPRDSDGDGITDIEEMLADTDPKDPCDPNPDCTACRALTGAAAPAPTATPAEVWVPGGGVEASPTPAPTSLPVTSPTPALSRLTPTPIFPFFSGLSRSVLIIVVIAAIIVLMLIILYLYYRSRESKEAEEGGGGGEGGERIIWR